MDDLRQMSARFRKVGRAPVATDGVRMLSDVFLGTALRQMGKDTHQLENRTGLVSVSGTDASAEALLEADTPYAGHHNRGNRWTAPNRFWDQAFIDTERAAHRLGGNITTETERMLTSGGNWNPRRNGWVPRQTP